MTPEIKIYNSLSRQKESLPDAKKLRLFVCGPTVYDYVHIGNARTFTVFDLFVKYLRSRNIDIFYLQNITDIDDKIITRAREEKTSWKSISKKFGDVFKKNMLDLGNTSVDRYARATDFIPQIITQVKTLIEKGHAYKIDGDGWYFDLKTFSEYGKLAGRTIEQAEDATSRIDTSNKKRNKGDFCLWKFSQPAGESAEPVWKTDLGNGRPGWHIEDTAITEYFFGPQYEIHGGGIDLKFPHHEAEIAQQESASGKKPFVKLWMHVEFLSVDGEKMSKSLGNYVTTEDFLKKHSADSFRWTVLMHHYRERMNFTEQTAETAEKNLNDITALLGKLKAISKRKSTANGTKININKFESEFNSALEDDFNTPKALAAIFGFLNEISPNIWDVSKSEANEAYNLLIKNISLFGINIKQPGIPWKISRLAKKRDKFRSSKQFVQSDELRKEIDSLGYLVEDTPLGPFVWPKN